MTGGAARAGALRRDRSAVARGLVPRRNLSVCAKCGYHFRIHSADYVALIADEGSWRETERELLRQFYRVAETSDHKTDAAIGIGGA